MGSTRLAMTDPHPRSNQPMHDSQSGDVLTFNGEIYNYKEIRSQLILLGKSFITESDTEVLLIFLATFGLDKLMELNGMYAFAYYSNSNKTVTLARDRLGKKPLYYRILGNGIYWSSELKPLERLTESNTLELQTVIEYLSLGYLLDPTTVTKDIVSLMPGQSITFPIDCKSPPVISNLQDIDELEQKYYRAGIRTTLTKAIGLRIADHDSVSVSLSGGVDSTIVAITLAELGKRSTAFSARWTDSDKSRYNTDADTAKVIASRLGIDYVPVEMITTTEVEMELERFVLAMQEPNNNPSGVSMMKLYSEIAKKNERLVLTGDGADEIYGGYARHHLVQRIPKVFNFPGTFIENNLLFQKKSPLNILAKVVGSQMNYSNPSSWLNWHWVFNPSELREILNPSTMPRNFLNLFKNSISNLVDTSKDISRAESLMLRDHQIWIPMESNRKLDRISMAFSIEARSPFQDDEVVSAARLAMSQSQYKKLNKQLLRKEYPELENLGVRNDKAGFTSPIGHWLRSNPSLVAKSMGHLDSLRVFNKTKLELLADSPNRGNYREMMQLWTLVVLSKFLEVNSSIRVIDE
jgi:asparagine synthase (glutamine-hydrolysing)